jgi:hypothetical protein
MKQGTPEKIINIETPNKYQVGPPRKKESLSNKEIEKMCLKIATVLTNPSKTHIMLNGTVNFKGKEVSLSKFL